MTNSPNLILGTAMWGWTVEKETCFSLLDQFYAAGLREIDAATNYPINKIAADFRKSESILLEWINSHGIHDLQVIMKVGSLNNLRTPDHQLHKSFLLYNLEDYQLRFGSNLDTLMIHWDNRDQEEEIKDSLEALQIVKGQGLRIGLSGIKHPAIYAGLNQVYNFHFRIQCKHNLLYSDFNRYSDLHQYANFIAYGINGGGIKLDQKYGPKASLEARGGDLKEPAIAAELRQILVNPKLGNDCPSPTTMNHCGLIYAYHQEGMEGILIGPSKNIQLQDSLNWMEYLKIYNYQDFYQQLYNLSQ